MDDWQKGDLALCIKAGNIICEHGVKHWMKAELSERMRPGVIRIVRRIFPHHCGCLRLSFSDEGKGMLAIRFRKIRPHTPDAEDRETIDLLTGAPVREPVA